MISHNPYPVTPTGFLVGSYLACILYGIHLTQIQHYFFTYRETLAKRLLVIWVWLLSTLQMVIIFGTGWRYFSEGTENLNVWGEFLWPLSFQDALIPLMAFTAQLFFGRRAWVIMGRKWWFGAIVIVVPSITFACGIALAITARLWADDPFVSAIEWEHQTKTIGVPSQIVAIVWMGLSAATDGSITFILIYHFRSHFSQSPKLFTRLISLTLETVLLTHICGGTMCIIFLASPAAHRTSTNIFWVLLEVITELYALSMLFTINARRSIRKVTAGGITVVIEDVENKNDAESMCVDFGVSGVERRVEGYQGDAPFGVPLETLLKDQESHSSGQLSSGGGYREGGSSSSGSETKAGTPGVGMRDGQMEYDLLPSLSGSNETRSKSSEQSSKSSG